MVRQKGRRLNCFSLADNYRRECLKLEMEQRIPLKVVSASLTGRKASAALQERFRERSEFVAKAVQSAQGATLAVVYCILQCVGERLQRMASQRDESGIFVARSERGKAPGERVDQDSS